MKSIFFRLTFLFFLISALYSCKTSEVMVQSVKDFDGTWVLDSIAQNSKDITQWFNTSEFQLTFQTTGNPETGVVGNYQFLNGAPFVVQDNGTWSLDHPKIPIMLLLKEEGKEDAVPVQFYFPPQYGGNLLWLICNPGCASNRYEYFLKRAN